jgi:hypothetical protein
VVATRAPELGRRVACCGGFDEEDVGFGQVLDVNWIGEVARVSDMLFSLKKSLCVMLSNNRKIECKDIAGGEEEGNL